LAEQVMAYETQRSDAARRHCGLRFASEASSPDRWTDLADSAGPSRRPALSAAGDGVGGRGRARLAPSPPGVAGCPRGSLVAAYSDASRALGSAPTTPPCSPGVSSAFYATPVKERRSSSLAAQAAWPAAVRYPAVGAAKMERGQSPFLRLAEPVAGSPHVVEPIAGGAPAAESMAGGGGQLCETLSARGGDGGVTATAALRRLGEEATAEYASTGTAANHALQYEPVPCFELNMAHAHIARLEEQVKALSVENLNLLAELAAVAPHESASHESNNIAEELEMLRVECAQLRKAAQCFDEAQRQLDTLSEQLANVMHEQHLIRAGHRGSEPREMGVILEASEGEHRPSDEAATRVRELERELEVAREEIQILRAQLEAASAERDTTGARAFAQVCGDPAARADALHSRLCRSEAERDELRAKLSLERECREHLQQQLEALQRQIPALAGASSAPDSRAGARETRGRAADRSGDQLRKKIVRARSVAEMLEGTRQKLCDPTVSEAEATEALVGLQVALTQMYVRAEGAVS